LPLRFPVGTTRHRRPAESGRIRAPAVLGTRVWENLFEILVPGSDD
jgi:hypothetical protein